MPSVLSVPSKEEMDARGSSDFSVFAEDEYRMVVDGYKRVNRISEFNKEGLETIDFYLRPVAYADDEEAELVDKDGQPVKEDSRLVFFFDPRRMGTIPVISKNRKFIAALLRQSPEDPIEVESYDDLIGKELIGAVVVQKNGKNKITDTRPIRNRARRRVEAAPKAEVSDSTRQTPSSLVEKAKEIFDSEPEGSDDEY